MFINNVYILAAGTINLATSVTQTVAVDDTVSNNFEGTS